MENNNYKKIGIYDDCVNQVVFESIPKNVRCLDVGCWTGNMGKRLISEKGCVVDGLAFKEDVLNIAKTRGYGSIYKIDLNKNAEELNAINKRYEYIICADVLEHTADPWHILSMLRTLLEKNGKIILSIPNIAFVQQRIFLLFGIFKYNPIGGIMDKTHLRFFTKETAGDLCKTAGFNVVGFSGYALVRKEFFFFKTLAKLWPSLFALQFLYIIEAEDDQNNLSHEIK